MTIVDCKPYLNNREYTSLGMFLSTHNFPIDSKMTKVSRKGSATNMIMAINIYDNNEVKRIALERLVVPRSGLLRRTVLRKLVQLIDKGLI